jgi:preprotein translocase subunit YajC
MGDLLSNPLLPFILLFVVMYFFMIRPQMKRQKAERSFQDSIKKGSKVVTTSGMHGKISEINETEGTLIIETMSGKIKFEKSALSMELSKKYQSSTE